MSGTGGGNGDGGGNGQDTVFENDVGGGGGGGNGVVPITFSETQHLAATIPLFISCPLSIMGSLCIIYMASKKARRGQQPYQWIMIFLSLSDILFSTCIMLQPFLSPSDYVSFAYGTAQTCSVVGALYVLAASLCALENCVLAIYFCLTMRYKWTPVEILKHYFAQSQCFALILASGPVIASLMTSSINPLETTLMCAIESYPMFCSHSPGVDCIRGEQADVILSARMLMTFIVAMICATATMLVYFTVVEASNGVQEESAAESAKPKEKGKLSPEQKKKVAINKALSSRMESVKVQAFYYLLINLNQLFWPFIAYELRALFPPGKIDRILHAEILLIIMIISNLVYPLQGFLNFFVYVRPSVIEWRKFYGSDPFNPGQVVPSWLTIVTRHVVPGHNIGEHVKQRSTQSLKSNMSEIRDKKMGA